MKFFWLFMTDFEQGKKYALFRYNRIQGNVRKRNQSFGYDNRISLNFGLKTSFEMSEGRLNVSFFSGRQIVSCNKRCSSGQFIKYKVKLSSLCIKLTICNWKQFQRWQRADKRCIL